MDDKIRVAVLSSILAAACALMALSFTPLAVVTSPPAAIAVFSVSAAIAVAALAALLWLLFRRAPTYLPDTDARIAFNSILADSKWAKTQRVAGLTDAAALRSKLDREIHNALRQSKITAWGKANLAGTALGPEALLPPEIWEKSEILFDEKQPEDTVSVAVPRVKRVYGSAWDLLSVRFSKRQIRSIFPRERRFLRWTATKNPLPRE